MISVAGIADAYIESITRKVLQTVVQHGFLIPVSILSSAMYSSVCKS